MENKFIKGVVFGGLLVSAVAVGFAMSKAGQECAKKIKENFKPMAKHLKENAGRLHDVAKEDFDELVTNLVEDYSKKKEISADSKQTLTSALKSKWDDIKEKFEANSSL